MSNEEFSMNDGSFEDRQYHKINNIKLKEGNTAVRLLPAMWSLSKMSPPQFYKYWKLHFGFVDAQGKKNPIVCPERTNKDKIVTERCPICDMLTEKKLAIEKMKTAGASDEQVAAAMDREVNQYKASGKYYAWALDANNQIGLLAMPKTVKDGVHDIGKKFEALKLQINGTQTGIWLDITRAGKGRYSTEYKVNESRVQDPSNPLASAVNTHVLTVDIANRLRTETRDLAKLYNPLSLEDLTAIANATDSTRVAVVTEIFAKRKAANKAQYSAQQAPVAPVSRDSTPVGATSSATNSSAAQSQSVSAPAYAATNPPANTAAASGAMAGASPASAQTAAPAPASMPPTGGLSEAEFQKLFQDRFGK